MRRLSRRGHRLARRASGVLQRRRTGACGRAPLPVRIARARGRAEAGWRSRVRVRRDFEAVAHATSAIEDQTEIDQGLAWYVRKRLTVEFANSLRERSAGGFEMAFQAKLCFAVGTEAFPIDDGRSNLLCVRSGPRSQIDMALRRPVASLAIDSERQGLHEFLPRGGVLVSCGSSDTRCGRTCTHR